MKSWSLMLLCVIGISCNKEDPKPQIEVTVDDILGVWEYSKGELFDGDNGPLVLVNTRNEFCKPGDNPLSGLIRHIDLDIIEHYRGNALQENWCYWEETWFFSYYSSHSYDDVTVEDSVILEKHHSLQIPVWKIESVADDKLVMWRITDEAASNNFPNGKMRYSFKKKL